MTKKFDFVRPTLIFAIVSLVTGGLSMFVVIAIQQLLGWFGVECTSALSVIWTIAAPAAFILPFLFYWHLSELTSRIQSLEMKLLAFNFFEYTFIQASLSPWVANPHTLCYVTDGQLGIEIYLVGLVGSPILVLLSFVFNKTFKTAGVVVMRTLDQKNGK